MERYLLNNGFPVDSTNTFKVLLSTPAVDILVTFTSQQLVAKGYHRTSAGEMIQFLATKFLRSRINTAPEIA